MRLDEYFNTEKFDGTKLAKELYDGKTGVLVVKGLLKDDARLHLLEEINANRKLLKPFKGGNGRLKERHLNYYWGSAEKKLGDPQGESNFPLVTRLANAYTELIKYFATKAMLSQKEINSIGVHKYWRQKTSGIEPHRDYSDNQLICSLVLEGYSPFYVSDNHKMTGKQTLEARAGDLIMMRGVRSDHEKSLCNTALDVRPIHSVGPVESERIAIILRNVTVYDSKRDGGEK